MNEISNNPETANGTKPVLSAGLSTNFNQMENKFQKLAKELCEKHPNKKLVIVTEPHVNGVDKYIVAYEQKRLKNGKYYHGDLIEQVLLS